MRLCEDGQWRGSTAGHRYRANSHSEGPVGHRQHHHHHGPRADCGQRKRVAGDERRREADNRHRTKNTSLQSVTDPRVTVEVTHTGNDDSLLLSRRLHRPKIVSVSIALEVWRVYATTETPCWCLVGTQRDCIEARSPPRPVNQTDTSRKNPGR